MTVTYEAIASTTLTSGQTSVSLNSFGGYTDLVLVVSASNPTNDSGLMVRFNGDSGSNYSDTSMYGNGSQALSFRSTSATGMFIGRTDTTISTSIAHFQNYANTTTNKTVISRGNDSAMTIATVGLWRNTAAITSMSIYDQNGRTFPSGSTFSLYGIKAE